jgi:hypothetical protein
MVIRWYVSMGCCVTGPEAWSPELNSHRASMTTHEIVMFPNVSIGYVSVETDLAW